jgi:U3 small nucleolar RNA-associated protein 3
LLFFITVARQAKALEAKLRIAQGEEGDFGEDDEDEEEDAGGDKDSARERGWGASKRAYYDADIADLEGSDEEEALADEEAEAIRLQRAAAAALHADDFGADEDEESSEEEDEDDDEKLTMGARAAKGMVESVPRDDDARAAAVRQDALELSALVAELRSILGEVRGRLGPLLREVRSGELATAEGVSYLEAKHTLLVHYAASIVFYLLLKAEGRPVRDHPVIKRLVEVRAYLEKVRPIDKRLQYQIEKLLAAAQRAQGENGGAAADDADALRHGPRPEALLGNGSGGGGGGGAGARAGKEAAYGDDGVYRPPRLNPVSMDLDDREGSAARKERRREIQAARRASRSTLVQELAAEIAGAPEEVGAGAPLGMDTVAALRQRQKMAARDAIEEELMIRVPLSRDERKQMKAQRRAGLSGKALLDNFVDDVADLVDGGGGDASVDPSYARHRANQKFGADLAAQQAAAARRNPRSGDADLPTRETLSDRRAKMDGIRAKNTVNFNENDDQFDAGTTKKNSGVHREEDEFYKSAKNVAATKKRARKEAHTQPDLLPPSEDPTTQGARRINNAIDKNRGLTPHRNKELKNPRKKHRVKYAEANVRRKGQVQEVRDGGGVYGGEGTGIKSKISKSVKF